MSRSVTYSAGVTNRSDQSIFLSINLHYYKYKKCTKLSTLFTTKNYFFSSILKATACCNSLISIISNFTPLLLNPPNQRHASHGRELVHDQIMGHLAIQHLYNSDKPDYHPVGISTMTVGCYSIVDWYWWNLPRQVQEWLFEDSWDISWTRCCRQWIDLARIRST